MTNSTKLPELTPEQIEEVVKLYEKNKMAEYTRKMDEHTAQCTKNDRAYFDFVKKVESTKTDYSKPLYMVFVKPVSLCVDSESDYYIATSLQEDEVWVFEKKEDANKMIQLFQATPNSFGFELDSLIIHISK